MSIPLGNCVLYLILLGFCFGRKIPSFRIIAPQVICEKSKNISTNNQYITISFHPKDDVKLYYKVHIYFKIISNLHKQRNILELWRAIRILEQRINVRDQLQIAERNLIIINKTELIPGVSYIFEIVGITLNQLTSKSQNITIEYPNGVIERNDNEKELSTNFILHGSEVTYANIPYILSAKLSFCKPRFDYIFQWNISNLKDQHYLHTSSSILKLPMNILETGLTYPIHVLAKQSDNSKLIAQGDISVEVLRKGFEMFITPLSAEIGINKSQAIEISINDFDNSKIPPKMEWDCKDENYNTCENLNGTNLQRIEIHFPKIGQYQVIGTVSIGGHSHSLISYINVIPNLLVNFDFENVPEKSIPAKSLFQFQLIIHDLVPNCYYEWRVLFESGYSFFDGKEIPNGFENSTVKNKEIFLSELVDYGNSPISRNTILNVPQASDNWKGLEGDTKYKFRLLIVCPIIHVAENITSFENKNVTGYFDLLIETNNSPIGMPLEIKPLNGIALKTLFEFSTGNAKDSQNDLPFSYEFMYKIENITINLGMFYETKIVETQLPYSESPIETMYTVCDSRLACSNIIGPRIQVDLPTLTENDIQMKNDEILNAYLRMDLNLGYSLILQTGLTYQKLSPNSIYTEFQDFVNDLLQKEINKLTERPPEIYYISKDDILQFVKNTKYIFEIFNILNTNVLHQLLELLDLTEEEDDDESTEIGVTENSTEFSEFRRKRQVSLDEDIIMAKSIVDSNFALTKLQLMERFFESLNESSKITEKPKLIEKINQLIIKMCKNPKIWNESILTRIVGIQLEKLIGNQMFGRNFTISKSYTSMDGVFLINISNLKNKQKYCVTLISYPEDYIEGDINDKVYDIQIFELLQNKEIKDILHDDNKQNDNILHAILTNDKPDTDQMCLIWSETKWLSQECETNILAEQSQIYCKCRRYGFLKLGKLNDNSIFSTDNPTLVGNDESQSIDNNVKYVPKPGNRPIVSEDTITPEEILRRNLTIEKSQTESSFFINSTLGTPVTETTFSLASFSALDYLIPILCAILILFIIGILIIFYKRRRRNIINSIQELEIMAIEYRESNSGIKYAKFHDEHLMTGSFNDI